MMTQEEAIKALRLERGIEINGNAVRVAEFLQGLDVAISALRPVSREQVEKVWKGEWKCHGDCGVTECSACGWNIEEYVGNYNFCPACGAPMTDEAVQMVMERMEKIK